MMREFGVVAIGRNEGERLKTCLASVAAANIVIYVDSGSTDQSLQYAQDAGAEIVDLDLEQPFTAARARNRGFEHLRKLNSSIEYVQFIDGDCELVNSWPEQAISFLDQHPDVAAVAGRRRERFPDRSVYNWLCDFEWAGPIGETRAFGGDVMIRTSALAQVNGYRDDMIAGEEPELCVQLRAASWRVWRLDQEITRHDAAITRLSQWWKRSQRTGYAFALGAHLHGRYPEFHKVREARRAWIWGVWLPIAGLLAPIVLGWPGAFLWLIYPLQVLRLSVERSGPLADQFKLAFFQTLARFPEGIGQLMFLRDHLFHRKRQLIEYKCSP